MDNNEKVVESTTATAEKNVEKKETESGVKMLTQEEVNEIVAKEKARAKKNSLSDDELKEYKAWKDSKKTESEKQAEREKEHQKDKEERDYLKKENLLLKKGIKEEDTDYIIYKVSKMDGAFEDNIEDYLLKNPRFTEKENVKATGTLPKGNLPKQETGVRALLRAKHPEIYK